jgi:hypothetical protein
VTGGFISTPGDEPVDPVYERFRDGWSKWIVGKRQYPGLRWSPLEGGGSWRVYAIGKFDYIDFGVVGPKSPLAYRWSYEGKPGYTWHWDGFFMPQWKLPDLWRAVAKAYEPVKAARPSAVWNPYEGSWREMRERAPAPPVPGTSPGDGPAPPPVTELERRLDELLRLYREDKITDEVLKQRTLELTREYG